MTIKIGKVEKYTAREKKIFEEGMKCGKLLVITTIKFTLSAIEGVK